jgi:hypothetical protein
VTHVACTPAACGAQHRACSAWGGGPARRSSIRRPGDRGWGRDSKWGAVRTESHQIRRSAQAWQPSLCTAAHARGASSPRTSGLPILAESRMTAATSGTISSAYPVRALNSWKTPAVRWSCNGTPNLGADWHNRDRPKSGPGQANGNTAEIVAILAAGYLRLLASRAKSRIDANLRPQESTLSACISMAYRRIDGVSINDADADQKENS